MYVIARSKSFYFSANDFAITFDWHRSRLEGQRPSTEIFEIIMNLSAAIFLSLCSKVKNVFYKSCVQKSQALGGPKIVLPFSVTAGS